MLWTTDARLTELCGESAEYHSEAWALEALRGELAQWRQYLEGDVYGYVVTDERGEHLDSCWGFYGFEYAVEEGRSMLAWHVEGRARKSAAWVLAWSQAFGGLAVQS